MSITTPPISTDPTGKPVTGTSGTTISNTSSDQLGANQFLDLLMDQLKYQNPASPTDPTQYLSQLAEMSGVEQETNTAQATAQTAAQTAVTSAISMIGDTITYKDQTTGASVNGTVQSVQITSQGPTLTVGGTAGIEPSAVTAITAGASGASSSSSAASGS